MERRPGFLPSERSVVWARLIQRFRLITGIGAQGSVANHVQPITDVDALLRRVRIVQVTVIRTAAQGAGGQLVTAVPANRKWQLHGWDWALNNAGDGTISQASIRDVSDSVAAVLFTQTAGANWRGQWLSHPVPLDSRDEVLLVVAAITTDTEWTCRLFIEEEEQSEVPVID